MIRYSFFLRALSLLTAVSLALLTGCAAVGAETIAPAMPAVEDMVRADAVAEGNAPADAVEDVVYDPEEEQTLDELLGGSLVDEDALAAVNGMTNILLVGLDARPKQKTGRSDTMMLLTLDAKHNSLKLTSFMRDLYVEIPGRKNNRLNAAYVFGGADLLKSALKKNFGVDVDYYVAVNFSVLADVIDDLGGLTLTIKDKTQMKRINLVIKEDNVVLKKAYPNEGHKTEDFLLTETGEQLLNGRQAQAYARYRKGESDFQRTQRQREVILNALGKIKGMSMVDLVKIAMKNLDNVSTDMSVMDMVSLAPAAIQLSNAKIEQLRIPIDKGYSSQTIAGMAVLVPNRAKNLKAITDFILEGE